MFMTVFYPKESLLQKIGLYKFENLFAIILATNIQGAEKWAISEWVEYYNDQRYHESLDNVTPADVYFERDKEVLEKRNRLKEQTLALRRQQHLQRIGV